MTIIAWKATAILVAAFCAAGLAGRRPAALRHFIWTAAFAALLVLPLSLLIGEGHSLPGPTVSIPVAATVVRAGQAPSPSIPWLPILYVAGALLSASRFLAGAMRTSWIVRRAAACELEAEAGARVVASADVSMPLAWGIARPVIVLPASALGWPAGRLRAVVLHEGMHHRRRDLLTQAMAQAACCLYWFHPLAWLALARQRREREHACDDAVLRNGMAAHDYATHLIDVVRAVAAGRKGWSDAPAMADTSSLEARVRAVLDRTVDRRPVGRATACLIGVGALLAVGIASTVSLRAQSGGGEITGVVQDPSGARVPNCRVTAKNVNGSNEETTQANAAGEYRFAGIPTGHYEIEASSRGFAVAKASADVVTGAVARVDVRLALGKTMEVVTVSGRRAAPIVAPQAARPAERIRVGGNVTPTRLLRQTRPVYPPELQQAGVEGVVMIRAIISKTGAVLQPQVVNSVDPRLAKAALEAVAQWEYEPTLLNGMPVETLTSIDVRFQLDQ